MILLWPVHYYNLLHVCIHIWLIHMVIHMDTHRDLPGIRISSWMKHTKRYPNPAMIQILDDYILSIESLIPRMSNSTQEKRPNFLIMKTVQVCYFVIAFISKQETESLSLRKYPYFPESLKWVCLPSVHTTDVSGWALGNTTSHITVRGRTEGCRVGRVHECRIAGVTRWTAR